MSSLAFYSSLPSPSCFHHPLLTLWGCLPLEDVAHIPILFCLVWNNSPPPFDIYPTYHLAQLKPVSFETHCFTFWPDFSVGDLFLLEFPKQCISVLLWWHLHNAVSCSLTLSCKLDRVSTLQLYMAMLTLLSEWMNFRALVCSRLLSYVR